MTEFTENTLSELEGLQHEHGYSQIYVQSLLKAKSELNRLDASVWKKRQSHFADRRWFHAFKLGLFEEEDFEEGGPAMDDAVLPGDVIIADPEEELAPADRETSVDQVDVPKIKPTEEPPVVETLSETPDDTEEKVSPGGEHVTQEETMEEEDTAHVDENTGQIGDEEVSPFVGWLKSLSPDSGYNDLAAEEANRQAVHEPESIRPVQTEEKVKKKKKKKKKKKEADDMPFQDLVVNSMELGEDISSEPLARLLREHGHFRLAEKIYGRLMEKYPEKSSYFAAQIEELNEEE